ncbi:unnamed protein product, partial [Rotaria sp. Silwood1]
MRKYISNNIFFFSKDFIYLFVYNFYLHISRLKLHEKSKDYESISDRSSIIDGDSGNSLLTTQQHSITTSAFIDKNNAPLGSPSQFSSSSLEKLREEIYLAIQNSISAKECAGCLFRKNLHPEQQKNLCEVIVDICAQHQIYERYFGLLGQELCTFNKEYTLYFEEIFKDQYKIPHTLENVQLQNLVKFYAHLFIGHSISWR